MLGSHDRVQRTQPTIPYATFYTIIGAERISRSTRILRSLAASSHRKLARSSRSQKWVVCIIATNVAPHDKEVSGPACRGRRDCAFATDLPTPDGALRFQCISHELQMPNALIGTSIIFSHDQPTPGSQPNNF